MKTVPTKLSLLVLILSVFLTIEGSAQLIDINGPTGSGEFGRQIFALPSGNIVVTDPLYDMPGGAADVGAVYLYNGTTGALISTLTGSTASDLVGLDGVTVLTNGNYVVISPFWNGTAADFGAVTWGDGTTGISGTVSAANSLVGSTENDRVGNRGVTALTNGNYVVSSSAWDGTATNVGAVTWGDGTTGITGTVSATNSLVGSTALDNLGSGGVTALTNGNYVVRNRNWDGTAADVGAVTWGDGTIGISGTVSATNSLVGSTAGDFVGSTVTALTNGNYVVSSPDWDGTATNVGAVTWGDGTTGITGTVSATNSLVGSTENDRVGNSGVTALTNGNYVVKNPNWDGTAADVGAVTWGDGTTGIAGTVSATNSLVGSTENDQVGNSGVTALSNGNYVVSRSNWNNGGASFAGAVTFGNGTTGISGVVSGSNSLVGSTVGNQVGFDRVTPLTNGNYVVSSSIWDNGGTDDVGAVTFGDGTTGISGVVSDSNSLVGSTAFDGVGVGGATALTNGNYVVRSPNWSNGGTGNVGAVTFGNGNTGITGPVSPTNSLVGSTTGDFNFNEVTALTNGNYVVRSPNWDNGGIVNAGAISLISGSFGTIAPLPLVSNSKKPIGTIQKKQEDTSPASLGPVTAINSVRGLVANGGNNMNFAFIETNSRIAVGRPNENIVTLFGRLLPTAADVTISGKVQTSSGRGIGRAIVTITDTNGEIRRARTNMFGYFWFEDVQAGGAYVFNTRAKGYSFATQVLNIDNDIRGFNIIAK